MAILAIVVALGALGRSAPVDPMGRTAMPSPVEQVVPTDRVAADALRFLEEHGLPIIEAANVMRTSMRIPSSADTPHAVGCEGPVLAAENPMVDQGSAARDVVLNQAALDGVMAELISTGPADLAAAVAALASGGGRIRIDETGRLDDSSIALQVGDDLIVSHSWLEAALANPASIHGNIAHEIAGHMRYGTPSSCLILESALAGSAAIADFDQYRASYLTYVYPEVEIYAELHELPYLTAAAVGDDPYVDIIVQVRRIKAAYPPELASLILDWIRMRCGSDPTLSSDARFYCEAALA